MVSPLPCLYGQTNDEAKNDCPVDGEGEEGKIANESAKNGLPTPDADRVNGKDRDDEEKRVELCDHALGDIGENVVR